jgi:hypothetical protein
MTAPLPASTLGAVAETTFRTLCERAGLVCNKSDRDVTGWDFDVQFPMPAVGPGHALDQRSAIACRVQLKATASAQGERVALKLSAADWLAKSPGPALICVLRMTPSGEPVAGYMIHLLDQQLAFVLKRLRRHQAEGQLDIHRHDITFDAPRRGIRFEPTPEGVRDALAAACGANPAAYGAEKRRQLAELGFEDDERYQLEAVIEVGSAEELADIALGRRAATAVHYAAYEARFGIPLPLQQLLPGETAELLLEPEVMAEATITIRGEGLAPPAVFKGHLLGTPLQFSVPDEARKSLIRTPDLEVTFGAGEMNLQTPGDVNEDRRTLSAWVNRLRGLVYLCRGTVNVGVAIGDTDARFEVPVLSALTGPYLADLPRLLTVAEDGMRLLRKVGLADDQPIGLEDIYAAGRDMYAAAAVLLRAPPSAALSFEALEPSNPPNPIEFLFVNHGAFGPHAFAYCARVTFERATGQATFTPSRVEPLDARPLPIARFLAYAEDQRVAHGVPQLLVREVLPAVPGAMLVADHDISA